MLKYKGEISILIAALSFAINAILIKSLGTHWSAAQITLFHFSFGGILTFAIILIQRLKFSFKNFIPLIAWAILSSLTLLFYNTAITLSSSGRVSLIYFTNPIFAAIFGIIFFHNRFKLKEFVAILLTLIGTIFVFNDGSPFNPVGDGIALLSAATIGLGNHFMEKARRDHPTLILNLASFLTGWLLNLAVLRHLPTITLPLLPTLIASGILLFAGYTLYAYGFGFVNAIEGSIISVTEIIWVLILSAILLKEPFSPIFLIGCALILAGVIGFVIGRGKIAKT